MRDDEKVKALIDSNSFGITFKECHIDDILLAIYAENEMPTDEVEKVEHKKDITDEISKKFLNLFKGSI